jgi:hypothetical protein
MPDYRLSNNFVGELTAPATTSATALSVSAATVAAVPSLAGSGVFACTLWDGNQNPEIIYVTAASGTTLTVQRAQEGTSAGAWSSGTQITGVLTRDIIQQIITGYSVGLGSVVAKAGDTMTGALILSGAPSVPLQAATKAYVDALVASGAYLPLGGGTMTGQINAGGYALTGLAAASANTDAVRKLEYDAAIAGKEPIGNAQLFVDALPSKIAVTVVATTNIATLSGEQTIDGVLTSASRVLLTGQTTASQNGIWVTAGGAWTRSSDMSVWTEVVGAQVAVQQGTVNANSVWLNTNVTGGTIAITNMTFIRLFPVYTHAARTTLASAGTTDLGTIASRNVSISGVTTITNFGSSANTNFPLYILHFQGALILTHNATNLILPGAANITTAANDTALALYLGGGNWQIIDYQRANGQALIAGLTSAVTDFQTFTASGTWTKPATGTLAFIVCVGGGGGGGGGKGASQTLSAGTGGNTTFGSLVTAYGGGAGGQGWDSTAANRSGGAGGGGALVSWAIIPLSSLGATETVTVGAGGAGGAGGTAGASSTSVVGGAGGSKGLGAPNVSNGAGGGGSSGAGGSSATQQTGGNPGPIPGLFGVSQGAFAGAGIPFGNGGGGTGGQPQANGAAATGFVGRFINPGGGGGGGTGNASAAGGAGGSADGWMGGGGAGGATGASTSANGVNGSDGSAPGGGGGGGGAGGSASGTGGTGGAGARGECRVWVF